MTVAAEPAATHTEPVFTLAQIQAMQDCPTLDHSYEATRLGPTVKQHLAWKRLAGRSEKTLDDYERTLARMCVRLPGRHVEDVTVGDLMLLLETWPEGSQRKCAAAIRGYFKWAELVGLIEKNPCRMLPEIKRAPRKVPDIFDATELAALVQAARHSLLPLTNQVRVGLMSYGLRKGGSLGLQVRDVNLTDRLVLVTEKGAKQRLIPIRGDLVRHLDEYLMTPYPILDRTPEPDDFFFFPHGATGPSAKHSRGTPELLWLDPTRPLSSTGYQYWWTHMLKTAGVKHRKGHMMRHTFGTNATDAGVDLATLQELMGHTSPETTAQYVHSSRTRLDSAAERIERFRREQVRSSDA